MGNATRLQLRSERASTAMRPANCDGMIGPFPGDQSRRGVWRAFGLLGLILSPVLAAIWMVPWFVTQDGPAHVYNAQIVAESFDARSAFQNYYAIQWQPIPNWAGHLVLAGLVRILPAWVADRLITSFTLAGFAASILWLRWRVAGEQGLALAAVLSGLLAMNVAWLFGFTNFMLGACLFPIALGYWWQHRDELTTRSLLTLSGLLALGYFCHLVSLGLTIIGLLTLAFLAPLSGGEVSEWNWRGRWGRLLKTSMSLMPAALLTLAYMRMSRRGGPMWPHWKHFGDPFLFSSWKNQLSWVDPLTISRKVSLPFSNDEGMAFAFLAPTTLARRRGLVMGGVANA